VENKMTDKKTIVYKIQRESDGLFSAGGSTPRFTKVGKLWRMKGHLTSHLTQLHNGNGCWHAGGPHVYAGCKILQFELIEIPAGPEMTVGEYLAAIHERKEVKEQKQMERRIEIERETRKQQYEKLRKEFG